MIEAWRDLVSWLLYKGLTVQMKRLVLLLAASAALTQYTACGGTPSGNLAKTQPENVYRLLGYATMSGESPLKLWSRLRDTREWLVGPLAPDGWAG